LPVYVIQPSQTAFEVISQIAAYAAVLPVSDGMGGLVLTRATLGGSFAPIALGTNILSARGQFSAKDRFQTYTVLASTQRNSVEFTPTPSPYQLGIATDPQVSRYRPLVIVADFNGPEESWQRRATWEMAVRAGRAYREDITVKGWRDAKGSLWQPNGTTRVDDGWVGFGDTLVIAGVKFAISDKGALTTLSVTRRQAFDVIGQQLGGQYQDPASGSQKAAIKPSVSGG
jgi:prophage tail gpP-like protein